MFWRLVRSSKTNKYFWTRSNGDLLSEMLSKCRKMSKIHFNICLTIITWWIFLLSTFQCRTKFDNFKTLISTLCSDQQFFFMWFFLLFRQRNFIERKSECDAKVSITNVIHFDLLSSIYGFYIWLNRIRDRNVKISSKFGINPNMVGGFYPLTTQSRETVELSTLSYIFHFDDSIC